MHSPDLINQFMQLRAQRTPLRHIAEQIGIGLKTAWRWSHQHKDEIDFYRAVHLEAIQQRYLKNYEDKLADLAREIEQIDTELKQRDFECVSTEFLLYRKTSLQARLETLAGDPFPQLPPPADAAAEPKGQQNDHK